MRLLTKSRYKLGLECPNKLYFTKKKEYANQKNEDPFLLALAQGGFQVEELARLHFPNGVLIEGEDWDYEGLARRTAELLQRENVVIFEAAFLVDGLFIRTDVLVKRGTHIELIEVKAKSYNPDDPNTFVGVRGGLVSSWKPYLFDLSFQYYVTKLAHPEWSVTSYFMLANKKAKASIDGVNQLFRIAKTKANRTGIERLAKSIEDVGESVLGKVKVQDVVERIIGDEYKYYKNLGFKESVALLKDAYEKDTYLNWPTSFSACKHCEFRSDSDALKSGFEYCFRKQHHWTTEDFNRPNIFSIWDFRKGNKLFGEGVVFLDDLTDEQVGVKHDNGSLAMSNSERQWIQVEKERGGDMLAHVEEDGLRDEMASWNFPLHFIDFETSTVALPFNKGRSPYEQVAFQFSHHIYHADGRIEHANEYLNTQAGVFPNFEFIRALKKALSRDRGSIFRYADHENSIMNAIHLQLRTSDELDKEELLAFIETISHSTGNSTLKWCGDRDMIDLLKVVKKFYYHPKMKGSNSIKAVLPAVLSTSAYLKEKYSKQLGSINLSSKNFGDDHTWFQLKKGEVIDPYKLLPSVFEGYTEDELLEVLSDINNLNNGGAALTAYGRMQYTNMSEKEREALAKSLLKYCELDTLAMVMIYEHFKEELVG